MAAGVDLALGKSTALNVNVETHSLGNQIGYGSGLGPKVEPTCRRPIQQTNQPLIPATTRCQALILDVISRLVLVIRTPQQGH